MFSVEGFDPHQFDQLLDSLDNSEKDACSAKEKKGKRSKKVKTSPKFSEPTACGMGKCEVSILHNKMFFDTSYQNRI